MSGADEHDEDEDGLPEPGPPPKPPSLGPLLLLSGCGAWLVWAVLHFGVAPGPTRLAVEPTPALDPARAAPAEPAVAGAPEPAPEPPVAPEETPWVQPDWADGIDPPDAVTYAVKRGGTLENVANLFKIYHHEILALNPGRSLRQPLAPGSEVVVWRADPDRASASVGSPSGGSLVGGVPMLDGPGRVLKMIPWKSWGTAETVATLDRVLREWRNRYPQAQPILVGNMSSPSGGKLEPHGSHQSGRDVDLGYPQVWDGREELNWRDMTSENLDRDLTWKLLRLLVETGAVEHVFVDTKLQKLLHDWAREHEPVPARELSRWLEYPRRPGSTGAIVQHVPGHTDHLHVRFACPPGDPGCIDR
jgi:hypothetical protein